MSDSTLTRNPEEGAVECLARITLFGYDSVEGSGRLFFRDVFWRGSRALLFGSMGLLLAPVVGLIPPHAPWAIGALITGAILARRKWAERRTMISLEAACPRCGVAFPCPRPTRLREPHTLTCESCHFESELKFLDE